MARIVGVNPTRQELLRLKRRKALALGLIDILQKDLDTFLMALFDYVRKIPSLRSQLYEALGEAYDLFIEAGMTMGPRKIEEIALVVRPIDYRVNVGIGERVLAAVLPSLQLGEGTEGSGLRYSVLETSASLDEGVQALKRAIGFVVKLAEMEACIRELLDWISLRKRQINRIQYQAIPEMDATIRYIELILEEAERQDAVRIRVLQSKRKERRERLRGE